MIYREGGEPDNSHNSQFEPSHDSLGDWTAQFIQQQWIPEEVAMIKPQPAGQQEPALDAQPAAHLNEPVIQPPELEKAKPVFHGLLGGWPN